MELLIVTGMSGAGKSEAANALEDIGYYCVDNVPPALISSFVNLSLAGGTELSKMAIITDVRGGVFFKDIIKVINDLKESGVSYKILFLDASDDVIVRRYKEIRRRHPMMYETNSSLIDAVKAERIMLREIRQCADYVIDTSVTSVINFRENIKKLFLGDLKNGLSVQCMSFGFKYGAPADADLIFDVRCLPNPFYLDDLRSKTGLDSEVFNYVMSFNESKSIADRIISLLDYSLPLYCKEGKSQLNIAFGCTGGKHRSVTFAEHIAAHLSDCGYSLNINHRDIGK